MSGNYLKILQELENSGAGEKRDISTLLLQLYPKPNSIQHNDVANAKNPAIQMLNEMVNNNHITYNSTDFQYIGVKEGGHEQWFENPFQVSITTQGLQYLHNQILNKSILESNTIATATNRAIKKSIPFQRTLSVLTFAIALLTGWIAWLTYEATKANEGHEIRLQSLEKHISQPRQSTPQDTTPKESNAVKKK